MRDDVEAHDEPQTTADKMAAAALEAAKKAGSPNTIVLIYLPDTDEYRDSSLAIAIEEVLDDEEGYERATYMMFNALSSLVSMRGQRLVVLPMKGPIGSDE